MKTSNVFSVYESRAAGYEIESKKYAADAILCEGENRFACSMAFALCVMTTALWYVVLYFISLLIFGKTLLTSNTSFSMAVDYITLLTAVILSLPVYHGYGIALSNTLKNRRTDLGDVLIPFSSFGMLFRSFALSAMSFLSCAVPLTAFVLFSFTEELRIFSALTVLLTPLWIWLTSAFRRMCRVHAFNTKMTFRECLLCSACVPKKLKKEALICAFSFTGNFLLSLVTFFVYGIWKGFAIKSLCHAMYAEQMTEEYINKKDK